MVSATARVLGPAEGKAGFLGSIGVRFMIDGDTTGGGFSLVEHPMAPHALAAPLHRHLREDEYSYVLEGRMGALLGDDVLEAGPGDLVFKPRGEWHTFWNARGRALSHPRDHRAGRLRAFLRGARGPRRRGSLEPGRPRRSLRALCDRDGPDERSRSDRALRRGVPGRAASVVRSPAPAAARGPLRASRGSAPLGS